MAVKCRPIIVILVLTGNEIDHWLIELNLPLNSTPNNI
jgi:hypothetical protein